jgi:hypothetical protein
VFDDAFGVEALEGVAGEGARDAEVSGGGFFAKESFFAAQAEANGESGKAGVEVARGGVGRRARPRDFFWTGLCARAGATCSGVLLQQTLAAEAGEGETDRLRADLVGLGEGGEAKIERGVAGGGEAAAEIVGDVIGQGHFGRS